MKVKSSNTRIEHQLLINALEAGAPSPAVGFLLLVVAMFKQFASTFEVAVAKAPAATTSTGGCFIATACYGSYGHPAVCENPLFQLSGLLVP